MVQFLATPISSGRREQSVPVAAVAAEATPVPAIPQATGVTAQFDLAVRPAFTPGPDT